MREKFASRVFLIAGIYGLITLLPLYFVEPWLGNRAPVDRSHPEHFYGFVGVALAWQYAFLLIARDVRRYRPLMLPAVLEKCLFGIASVVLYVNGRVVTGVVAFGAIDLAFAVLFSTAFALLTWGSDVDQWNPLRDD